MPARNGLIRYPELEPLVKRNAANELGRADDLRRGFGKTFSCFCLEQTARFPGFHQWALAQGR
jgi:hypothetical protein